MFHRRVLRFHSGFRQFSKSVKLKMEHRVPRLLLFDIDGTLTTSHYKNPDAGHPMSIALSIAFGKDIRRGKIEFSGGTDGTIIRDVLEANNITEENTENYKENVLETYRILPGLMRKGIAEGNHSWSALLNVHELLLRLSKIKGVQLALLTGNIKENARIKLKSASVDVSLFEVEKKGKISLLGAFGSDDEVRSKLVPIAQRRYSEYLDMPVSADDMIIIGDSPKDILCAHDNDVACVAVATGHFTPENLDTADHVLSDFGNLDESIKAIRETKLFEA